MVDIDTAALQQLRRWAVAAFVHDGCPSALSSVKLMREVRVRLHYLSACLYEVSSYSL